MARRYFGTDGIRGKVGEGAITPEFVMRLGWAAGRVLAKRASGIKQPTILIGKDTRVSGYLFESALQAGIISAGVNVGLLGPMPTPAIAYLTRSLGAQAGIVISASHNPYYDNGIKFFSATGSKLSDELEQAIEAELDKPMVMSDDLGKAHRVVDAGGRYIEFCKASIPQVHSLSQFKVVLDCANGATYQVAPKVFRELGAEVVVENNQPNGVNINASCGSTSPSRLQASVVENNADLGIAFDGDGDRVIMVDHKGEAVDGDELLFIMAAYCDSKAASYQGVVGTQMSNLGLELALKKLGISFIRTKVGDRFVKEGMSQQGWALGGESSGHLICSDVTTTGDGIVAALQVLKGLAQSGLSLFEAKSGMQKYPQTMINVRVVEKKPLADIVGLQDEVDRAEAILSGEGRVLLRPSGTEPLIRVMVEGKDPIKVKKVAHSLAEFVESAV